MSATKINEWGSITINDQVLATIASNAAMESYGIVGFAFKNATDGFFELLKRENMAKGVRITSKSDGLVIDLTVVLEYGVRIAVVCENIIDTVKFTVEKQTGLNVERINVNVQGVRV